MKKIIFISIVAVIASSGAIAAQQAGAPAPALSEDGAQRVHRSKRARFKAEAASNQDGVVSRQERKAFRGKRRQLWFAKRDKNGDQQLTQDELGRMPQDVFTKLDADHSGGLSAAELSSHRGARQHRHRGMHKRGFGKRMFERVDSNKDGKISRAEMRAAADRRFDRIDSNRDGAVTREELKAHKPWKKAKAKTGKRQGAKAKDKRKSSRSALERANKRGRRAAPLARS